LGNTKIDNTIVGGLKMNITHDTQNILLTAGETAELFNAYINNSASKCVLSYFIEKAHDPEIKSVLKVSLDASNKVVEQIANIFKTINHPLPRGFTMEDVNLKASSLYSDRFMLTYVRYMAKFGLTNYAEARGSCTRADVRDFFNQSINTTIELFNMADEVMLGKGLFIKEPNLPIPEIIDFVDKKSFLKGFFGEKRPLNASEISRLNLSYHRNSLGKAFLTGLCQSTRNKVIKDYLLRGIEISENHMETIGSALKKADLTVPTCLDTEVTNSTETVFSDKLILFHVVVLDALGLAITGISLSRVMRHDLSLVLTRFMSDIALYAEDGFHIMIDNKWFERMPEAADRKELLEV
jgi:spore coat protein CotF